MADPTLLNPGMVVAGTFEVDRLLGRGGMGEVWAARHTRLPGKEVAIKVLHAPQLSAEAQARFRREAEVAAKLSHPNVVTVHDFNVLPTGAPYLVLELLQGESLSRRLSRGPLAPDEAAEVVRQVGAALEATHAQGVVHRDLKPDNVFLCPQPFGMQVKLLDFGISKIAGSTSVQTQEAALLGTPQYMSPEQALGNNQDVGAQADVWALGAMAYEMLSGRPPFTADNAAKLIFRIAYESYPPLAEVASVSRAMDAAVAHALEKPLERRTRTVAEFVREFTGAELPAWTPTLATPAPSGMATPGAAVPDEVGMARTAAPTPITPIKGPALATPRYERQAPTEPDARTSSTGSSSFKYVLVAALVAVVSVVGSVVKALAHPDDAVQGLTEVADARPHDGETDDNKKAMQHGQGQDLEPKLPEPTPPPEALAARPPPPSELPTEPPRPAPRPTLPPFAVKPAPHTQELRAAYLDIQQLVERGASLDAVQRINTTLRTEGLTEVEAEQLRYFRALAECQGRRITEANGAVASLGATLAGRARAYCASVGLPLSR
ncbi:MAG: serine/threonine protein kinase [Myxococcaceae bacterium]|nr:serine/threonine protein kinase [Myxococcaceae bacterium]